MHERAVEKAALLRRSLARLAELQVQADEDARIPRVVFPLEVLPEPMRRYVATSAVAARVPAGAVALPMLAMAGAMIGNRARLAVGPGWEEYPGLWVMLVGDSGSGKTPALRLARAPFSHLEQVQVAAGGARPLVTTGASFSHLARVLESAPGVTLLRDELVGLTRQWQRRGGDERQRFLSLWSSEPVAQIGASAMETVSVAAPVMSIVGGAQPGVLARIRSREEDGLLERFVPVGVPERTAYWGMRDATGPAPDVAGMAEALRPLLSMSPRVVGMSDGAQAVWGHWYNDNIDDAAGVLRRGKGFLGKLPAQVARCALVLHLLWGGGDAIDEAGMARAVELAAYLRWEVRWHLRRLGVRGSLDEAPTLRQRVVRAMAEGAGEDGWIARKALHAAVGNSVPAEELNRVLAGLVGKGVVEAREVRGEGGGRARREYRIADGTT